MGRKKKSRLGISFYFFFGVVVGLGLIYAKDYINISKFKENNFISKLNFKKTHSDKQVLVQQTEIKSPRETENMHAVERSVVEEVQPVIQKVQPVIQKVQPVIQKVIAPKIPEKSIYTVQVASFKDYDQAKEFVLKLNDQEVNAYIAPTDIEVKGEWYRIFVGEYMNKLDAQKKSEVMKQKYEDCFVRSL